MRKEAFLTKEKVQEIEKTIPTPFHVYDEAGLRKNLEDIKKAFAWNKGYKEYFAVKATPNIEIIYNSRVLEIQGESMVDNIVIEEVNTKESMELAVNGVFIAVGTHPLTECFSGLVDMNEQGYIIANEDGVTSTQGVFVAGDSRTKRLRQVITAASDGANAVTSADEYLRKFV